MYELKDVGVGQIRRMAQPRSGAGAVDIEGLAISTKLTGGPIQPPIVHPLREGEYLLVAGERRFRAVESEGASTISVLVLPPNTSAARRHVIATLENLHRRDLHPLDEAVAIKLYWLYRNAIELGLSADIEELLASDSDRLALVSTAQNMLEGVGWHRNKPPYSYEDCLDDMGLGVSRATLMRKLRILNLESDVIARMRQIAGLTQAATISIGKLPAPDQRALLDAIVEDPDLVQHIRRICSTLTTGVHETLEAAIAEVRGEILGPDSESMPDSGISGGNGAMPPYTEEQFGSMGTMEQAVIRLLDVSADLEAALVQLRLAKQQADNSPATDSWMAMADDAIETMRSTLEGGHS